MEDVSLTVANGEEEMKESESLSQYLTDLPTVYQKLEKIGMTKLKIFAFIDAVDLDKLCKEELCLTFLETVEFKSVIREIQSKHHIPHQPMVHISENDKIKKRAMQELMETCEQLTHIQIYFEAQSKRMDEYAYNIKSEIDDEFEALQKTLEQRKECLHTQVDQIFLIFCF